MTLIAVYGTLRPGGRAWNAFGLAASMRHVGPARIPGDIVNLGGYPGLIDGQGEVVGDLLECLEPAVIDRLDEYEGEGYERVTIRLADPAVDALVWRWTGSVEGATCVPGNDWANVPVDQQADPTESDA